MRIARRLSITFLLAALSSGSTLARTVHAIPEEFRGSWYSDNVSQCEIHTLEVNENGVFDFGGFEFTWGRLDGETLTFVADRCEEGECAGSPEEVTLRLQNNRLHYSHFTDESGDSLPLTRCPS